MMLYIKHSSIRFTVSQINGSVPFGFLQTGRLINRFGATSTSSNRLQISLEIQNASKYAHQQVRFPEATCLYDSLCITFNMLWHSAAFASKNAIVIHLMPLAKCHLFSHRTTRKDVVSNILFSYLSDDVK